MGWWWGRWKCGPTNEGEVGPSKKGGQGMRMAQRLSIWGVLVVGSWGVVGLVVVGLRWLLRGAW